MVGDSLSTWRVAQAGMPKYKHVMCPLIHILKSKSNTNLEDRWLQTSPGLMGKHKKMTRKQSSTKWLSTSRARDSGIRRQTCLAGRSLLTRRQHMGSGVACGGEEGTGKQATRGGRQRKASRQRRASVFSLLI